MNTSIESEQAAESLAAALIHRSDFAVIGTGVGAAYRVLWNSRGVDQVERHDLLRVIPGSGVPLAREEFLCGAQLGSGRFAVFRGLMGARGNTDAAGRSGVMRGVALLAWPNDARLLIRALSRPDEIRQYSEVAARAGAYRDFAHREASLRNFGDQGIAMIRGGLRRGLLEVKALPPPWFMHRVARHVGKSRALVIGVAGNSGFAVNVVARLHEMLVHLVGLEGPRPFIYPVLDAKMRTWTLLWKPDDGKARRIRLPSLPAETHPAGTRTQEMRRQIV